MSFDLIVRFQGDEAARHHIPAYEGAQSIQGISRSLVLINHYFVTGTIRKRAPFTDDIKVYLEPLQRGSLDAILKFIIENPELLALGGAIGVGITTNLITDAIKTIFSRVIGKDYKPKSEDFKEIEEVRPGDLDALVDAIEPSMRLGHTAIDQGVQNIVIIKGGNNIVNLNSITKEYVNRSEIGDLEDYQDVSVGSLNVNTGYGRVFVHDLGKTVPFSVVSNPKIGTYSALSHSLDQYANGLPGDVQIKFRRVTAPDGRTKKFLIFEANIPEREEQ